MTARLAPAPAHGTYQPGYEAVASQFAKNLASGEEIGAGLTIYRHGERVVHLWGGLADRETGALWQEDTRVIVFSVTKAFVAAALSMLADRGQLDWDKPVAHYWPGFAAKGKGKITVRTLVNHQAGLPALSKRLSMDDVCLEERRDKVRKILEAQRPAWTPGEDQGYHAITFGLYVGELFRQVTGEDVGNFLQRELFSPLGSDVCLGTPAAYDDLMATLYPPPTGWRLKKMTLNSMLHPESSEARVMRDFPRLRSLSRRSFTTPSVGSEGVAAYDSVKVRRASLPWASATGSADGVARTLLPFAQGGLFNGRRYVSEEKIEAIKRRQGWSFRDKVLHKPMGWSNGFLKEERHMFSPNPTSFGHSGMGGSLVWCDPETNTTIGYVMNRMDWGVRSERVLSLCHALYDSDIMLEEAAQRLVEAS